MNVLVAEQRHRRAAGHHIIGHAGDVVLQKQIALHHGAFGALFSEHRIGIGGRRASVSIGNQGIVSDHLVERIKGVAAHDNFSGASLTCIAYAKNKPGANLPKEMFVQRR